MHQPFRSIGLDALSLSKRIAVPAPSPEPSRALVLRRPQQTLTSTPGRFFRPDRKLAKRKAERPDLQASAIEVTDKNGIALGRLHEAWQDASLGYYDRCGECRFAATFFSVALAQMRFFPALKNEQGKITEIEDAQVVDIFNRVRDHTGSMAPIVSNYGRLMFLTGEGYLAVTGTGDADEPEVWEFLSPTELRVDSAGNYRRIGLPDPNLAIQDRVSGALEGELSLGQVKAWRMWRSHPAISWRADSPMRSVLDLFEELILLTAAVRARVKSRLSSAGILLLPEEITFPSDEEGGDEDPNNDPFLVSLIEHMTQPIVEEGTASAVVPYVLRAARDYLDSIRHIRTNDPNETYREGGLRMETIKRISIGIDLPSEILMGLADSNHWTAWMVDEQIAKAHIFPIAGMFSNDLASAYLRPACRIAGIENWREITIGYDPAQLVNHPDKSQNAKDLFDRGEISGETLRTATGFSEDDIPTDEDRATWLAVKLRTPDLLRDQPENDSVSPLDRTGASETEGAPSSQPQLSHRASKLIGAAELSVTRARSAAGARLRTKARNNCADCVEQIKDEPNHRVAFVLGPEQISSFSATPRSLVAGTADEFYETAVRWGVPDAAARALGDQVEAFAASTLCLDDRPSLPDAFDEYVSLLEAA